MWTTLRHKGSAPLDGKTVVLGVTGGIAAYKAAEVTSLLVKRGADVHVVMTEAATKFVAPLTFRTLSRNPVVVDMFADPGDWNVRHVALAEKASVVLVAPATANCIGKVACGIADDLLTTVIMATRAPVLFVPSMNQAMYDNPLFRGNLERLLNLGYRAMEPGTGYLACGAEGKGRMPDPEDIVAEVERICLARKDLVGLTVVVTAGPTEEPIDPVRHISNRSSGKMGYALAEAARDRGARVVLVSGPTALAEPSGVKLIRVRTTREMLDAVLEVMPDANVIIGAAAPADWRPATAASRKLEKGRGPMTLQLETCEDIIATVGRNKGDRVIVGFAAETHDLLAHAREKMSAKNLDLVVANDVTCPGAGFGSDFNQAKMLHSDGRVEEVPLVPKVELAHRILDAVASLLARRSGQGS
ncbi:MAG: bifunctional phosphopantothenoylcysteine decarboxylase/phosphopantothenate--cysteine ligase CoaBC [Firmicutes bacterium]|jgi:phosphopantothenoylcysteine decarboxylase/phosphopantothenate--cysteine ligase|nr:bifunctional phosphopantothenoylcysteine decarboxylase/phosphopantothenate--cysteine ligase CoaBC [Bacillota bacterium]MDH7495050.1 bifunctional phosphopantothenoylcysteine decarboxylase/phosphopantothenate--cysteine ligase CoaBC [Bacillota bacterium]